MTRKKEEDWLTRLRKVLAELGEITKEMFTDTRPVNQFVAAVLRDAHKVITTAISSVEENLKEEE